ncbi:hypothetical protein CLOSTMETH_01550 [[Clostridium] methylpentosum DSM 5476]|uniref:Uncharacterized protein n=1 Tax=[Clostridium] methylpentosum DSM 5476 TaxID=537013 RepID=C0ECH9_9FIRM|nr:hypothetical protein CLOSTMETH_01550 [[Clostridium] methylpentosum DSM 5476]
MVLKVAVEQNCRREFIDNPLALVPRTLTRWRTGGRSKYFLKVLLHLKCSSVFDIKYKD